MNVSSWHLFEHTQYHEHSSHKGASDGEWKYTLKQKYQMVISERCNRAYVGQNRLSETTLLISSLRLRENLSGFNLLKPKTNIYVASALTFRNSVFCPAFMCFVWISMCFVWISEQTAIISLYSINLSVFKTEAESVYCAVWNGSLNQTDTASYLKG